MLRLASLGLWAVCLDELGLGHENILARLAMLPNILLLDRLVLGENT